MGLPVNDYAHLEYWQRKAIDFVERIWSRHRRGFVFVAVRHAESQKWTDIPIKLGAHRDAFSRCFADFDRRDYDLYFCPNAFSRPIHEKRYALPTPYAWADIDGGDPEAFNPRPTILWETSPGSYQGLWEFDGLLSPAKAESVSKWLAYSFGADRGGWSIIKYLRVPYTFNHKPEHDLPRVKVSASSVDPIPTPVEIPTAEEHSDDDDEVDLGDGEPSKWWRSIYRRYRKKLHPRVRFLIDHEHAATFERDRSKCIYEIVADLHRTGASAPEIESIVWHNPYFINKHGKSLGKLYAEVGRILRKLGDTQ